MQVHRQDAVDASHLQHVGHDLGRDRDARRTRAAVLAGIAEIGNRGGDAASGSAAQCINHDHDFHQVVIGGSTGGLQDEDVLATHVLVDFDHHFAVREATDGHLAQGHIEVVDYVHGQPSVGRAREDHEAIVCHDG
ncbi:hypothetical protein D3C78_1287070 [compost metagenome]